MPFLTFICPVCLKTFQKAELYYERHVVKHGHEYQPKCSTKCVGHSNNRSQKVNCKHCGNLFTKTAAQIRKTSQHYCSRSCAASFNNRHKQHGTRRSTLEQFIESQIVEDFPKLPFECNSKTLIGSELDFYFPTLQFAIELNGIFHYKPIFGLCKLEQICESDQQKLLRCHDLKVKLYVVNASNYSHLTSETKNYYWNIVKPLLLDLLQERSAALRVCE